MHRKKMQQNTGPKCILCDHLFFVMDKVKYNSNKTLEMEKHSSEKEE